MQVKQQFAQKPARQFSFVNGKLSGTSLRDNLTTLKLYGDEYMNNNTSCDWLNKTYSFEVLRETFPWANVIRAGFILVYNQSDANELLFVMQKGETINSHGKKQIIKSRYGFPKGLSDVSPNGDASALYTAARKLYEETRINIFLPEINAKIYPVTIVIRMPEHGFEEIVIYFMASIKIKPQIKLADSLIGYSWIDISDSNNLLDIYLSLPTKNLLSTLQCFNFTE